MIKTVQKPLKIALAFMSQMYHVLETMNWIIGYGSFNLLSYA